MLRFRADVGLRNGSLAHWYAGLLAARGIHDIMMEARTMVVRDPSAADNVMGLRTWAHTAAGPRLPHPRGRGRFVAQFDDAVRAGRFAYAVTFFVTAGMLPLSD
ncbi:hypothetical protein AB0K02_22925 [Streptomyces sp. NPDC049597]|uniref:hypothetical protein n=1 Tax=Streptomyces sp. NPDC049597 TaxID=3155276 RepID=UPI00342167BA